MGHRDVKSLCKMSSTPYVCMHVVTAQAKINNSGLTVLMWEGRPGGGLLVATRLINWGEDGE